MKLLVIQANRHEQFANLQTAAPNDFNLIINSVIAEKTSSKDYFKYITFITPGELFIEIFNFNKYDFIFVLANYKKRTQKILLILSSFLFRSPNKVYMVSKTEHILINSEYLSYLFVKRPSKAIKYLTMKLFFFWVIFFNRNIKKLS